MNKKYQTSVMKSYRCDKEVYLKVQEICLNEKITVADFISNSFKKLINNNGK